MPLFLGAGLPGAWATGSAEVAGAGAGFLSVDALRLALTSISSLMDECMAWMLSDNSSPNDWAEFCGRRVSGEEGDRVVG